jgi:hypothetical protein
VCVLASGKKPQFLLQGAGVDSLRWRLMPSSFRRIMPVACLLDVNYGSAAPVNCGLACDETAGYAAIGSQELSSTSGVRSILSGVLPTSKLCQKYNFTVRGSAHVSLRWYIHMHHVL